MIILQDVCIPYSCNIKSCCKCFQVITRYIVKYDQSMKNGIQSNKWQIFSCNKSVVKFYIYYGLAKSNVLVSERRQEFQSLWRAKNFLKFWCGSKNNKEIRYIHTFVANIKISHTVMKSDKRIFAHHGQI